MWHPTKEEIEDWLESKTLAFAQEERIRSWLSIEDWLDWYIYSDSRAVRVVVNIGDQTDKFPKKRSG